MNDTVNKPFSLYNASHKTQLYASDRPGRLPNIRRKGIYFETKQHCFIEECRVFIGSRKSKIVWGSFDKTVNLSLNCTFSFVT